MGRNGTPVHLKPLRVRTRRVAIILERFLGTPRPSSRKSTPLDMLIATILSQNTNDKNSHRAYTAMRAKYPTWEEVAAAPLGGLRSAIRIGGMANQKAPRIQHTLRAIRDRYGEYNLDALKRMSNAEVIAELTSLDGVGVKTAACVLLFSMGRDVFPVDTHVHRICGRLGLAPGCATPEKTFSHMQGLVPAGKAYSFHTNLIRFGRMICRSANPACGACPLYDECDFEGKHRRAPRAPSRTDHDFMLLDNVG